MNLGEGVRSHNSKRKNRMYDLGSLKFRIIRRKRKHAFLYHCLLLCDCSRALIRAQEYISLVFPKRTKCAGSVQFGEKCAGSVFFSSLCSRVTSELVLSISLFSQNILVRYLFYGCYSTPGIMQLSSLRASLVNLFLLFSTSLDLSLR